METRKVAQQIENVAIKKCRNESRSGDVGSEGDIENRKKRHGK